MRRSGLPDALGARELIADGQLADSLARGGRNGITQHRTLISRGAALTRVT
jgi:hypothetical protein